MPTRRPDRLPESLSTEDVGRLRLVLLRLARRLRQNTSGITQSQLSALWSISHAGPLTVGELAARENVQPPSISRIVGALEGEGWIERVAHERDGRIALVQLTKLGRRHLAKLSADREAWLARRLTVLSADERDQILAALPLLEQLLSNDGDDRP